MFQSILNIAILASALANAASLVDPVSFDNRDIFTLNQKDVQTKVNSPVVGVVTTSPGFATFDRLDTSGLGSREIGYSGGVYYRGFAAANNTLVSGLQPRSAPNFAVYGRVAATLSGSRFITSRFPGTKTTSFGVTSLFYGCTNAAGTRPAPCVIAFAGYDDRNELVAFQAVTYRPPGGRLGALTPLVLDTDFNSGLVTLRVATLYARDAIRGASAFDNIKYAIVRDIPVVTPPVPVSSSSTASSAEASSTETSSTEASSTGSSAEASSTGSSAEASSTGSSAEASSTGSSTEASSTGSSAEASSTGSSAEVSSTGSSAEASSTGSSAEASSTGSSAESSSTASSTESSSTTSFTESSSTESSSTASSSSSSSLLP